MEILIALLLISLTMGPLISPVIRIYRREAAFLNELAGQRLAEQFIADEAVKLYRNQVPFNFLINSGWQPIPQLNFQELGYRGQFRYAILTNRKERKEGTEESSPYDLVWLHVRLTPQNPTYLNPVSLDRNFVLQRTVEKNQQQQ